MRLLLIVLTVCVVACSPSRQSMRLNGYRLDTPDHTTMLSSILKEISGITQISGDTFACMQDEKGVVFFINPFTGAILQQLSFYSEGDYEGITKVGDTLFILRSDGVLYALPNYASKESGHISYQTGIPAKDNEGLCYDAANNRLLIGCKSNIGKGKELKNIRAIYAFDLQTKSLSNNPVLEIDVDDLEQFAIVHNIAIPDYDPNEKKRPNGPEIKLRISALAIHPVTGRWYILSARDKLMIILEKDGTIHNIVPLNPEIFPQAEGITFTGDNTMCISSEGKKNGATVTTFNYKGKK